MRRRLGEALLARGLVTEAQLIAALELQQRRGWRLGQSLVALGFLSEDRLLEVLGSELNLEVVDVRDLEPPEEALHAVRARIALEHGLLPLSLSGELIGPRVLKVAMADPGDLRIIDELSFTTGAIIEPVLARATDIARAVVRAYRLDPESPAPSGAGALVYPQSSIEPEDELPLVPGRPPSSLPPPHATPFSVPPLAVSQDLYSVPRPLDPSRSALGDFNAEHLYPHALFDDAGGVVRGAEIRTLERRFLALLRLLVKRGLLDRDELLQALEESEGR